MSQIKILLQKIIGKFRAFWSLVKNIALLLFSWFFGLALSFVFVFVFTTLYMIAMVKKFYKRFKRKITRALNSKRKRRKLKKQQKHPLSEKQ